MEGNSHSNAGVVTSSPNEGQVTGSPRPQSVPLPFSLKSTGSSHPSLKRSPSSQSIQIDPSENQQLSKLVSRSTINTASSFTNDPKEENGDDDVNDSASASLPLPPPYDIFVNELSVKAPPPLWTIPYLPIPITVPRGLQNLLQGDSSVKKTKNRREEDGEIDVEKGERNMRDDRTSQAGGKTLLRDIDLRCEAGEMLAIIGGSGSGKTTLLTTLASRLGDLSITSGSVSYIPSSSKSSQRSKPSNPLTKASVDNKSTGRGVGASQDGGQRDRKNGEQDVNEIIGYVRQDDFLLPYLTVQESLHHSASLRLPSSTPPSLISSIVDTTINQLGLRHRKDTLVGGSSWGLVGGGKGLSGGERRRLSIGMVTVTRPSVLVLDEPTTGLDAFVAFQLLETLSNLAKTNKIGIVASLHQPRSDAFPLFDRLALLSSGGNLIYSGPTSLLLPHFSSLGYSLPHGQNPLDWVIDLSSIDTRDDERESETGQRVGRLREEWGKRRRRVRRGLGLEDGGRYEGDEKGEGGDKEVIDNDDDMRKEEDGVSKETIEEKTKEQRVEKSVSLDLDKDLEVVRQVTIQTQSDNAIHRITSQTSQHQHPHKKQQPSQNPSVLSLSSHHSHSTSYSVQRPGLIRQTIVLTSRALKNVSRNRPQAMGFLAQAVIIGIVNGGIFWRPEETPNGIQTLKTVVYMHIVSNYYLVFIVFIYILCSELTVFDFEREDGLYSTLPYMLATSIAYLPLNVIVPTVYSLIIYFMCGLRTDADVARNIFIAVGNAILQQLSAMGYAFMAASYSRNFAQASLLANGCSIAFILSAGYLLLALPVYIGWTRWISPYFYGFHWVAVSQFRGRNFTCEGVTGIEASQCVGENVLRGLRFHMATPTWVYPVGLFGFVIVSHAIACLILQFYHPGGTKHAGQIVDSKALKRAEKATLKEESPLKIKRGVVVTVNDLRLAVTPKRLGFKLSPKKRKEVEILRSVTAQFYPGQVTAVMGPSGSGKTSFLQLLSKRLHTDGTSNFHSSGEIKFNGNPPVRGHVAYVEQSDQHLLPALTVRETLRYAAMLRLRGLSSAEKSARAEEVLREMGLRSCADTLVGGDFVKGISGGEKRRLSLAIQLLSNPDILVADESLSGLDSWSARSIMEVLQDLARKREKTVILSVHQPRSDIWAMIDSVLLLAEGGRVVYEGSRDEILPRFAQIGLKCPAEYNPADWLLDIISVNYRTIASQKRTSERLYRILDNWDEYTNSGPHISRHQELPDIVETPSTDKTQSDDDYSTVPFSTALPIVLGRSFRNLSRQQDIFVARIANPPFLALLFWMYFLRLSKEADGVQNRIGLLQENSALQFVGMLACLAIYPSERQLLFHEYASSARYGSGTFLMSYTLQELPMEIVSSILYSIIFVLGMGLQHTARIYWEFFIGIVSLFSFGESIGIIFATWVTDGGLSVSLISSALTVASTTSGIVSVSIPRWIQVLAWASVIKPSARLQVINEFAGLDFHCSQQDLDAGSCLATSGEQELTVLGIDDRDTFKFVWILVAQMVLYRILAWISLEIRLRWR